MSELLTMQDLANGHLDVKALGEAANGDENTIVTTRTGNTYPSAERAINIMFENGGLPAKPFKTKALMTASALANDKYAMVTDDTVNNGLYIKTAGAWVKSEYDPLEQAKSYTDSEKTSAINTAAADATTKASAAKTEAIAAAAIDAENKAKAEVGKIAAFDSVGDSAYLFTDKNDAVLANLNSRAEFEANDFVTLNGSLTDALKVSSAVQLTKTTLASAVLDDAGTILTGFKTNGDVVSPHPPLQGFGVDAIRSQLLDNDSLNSAGAYLDRVASENVAPVYFDVLVAENGTDGLGHCRMGSMYQLSETRFYVAYTQFLETGTDQAGGILCARFVDIDWSNNTSTVGATRIIHDGTLVADEHPPAQPHFFKVKDGVILIANIGNDLVTYKSIDNCMTWIEIARFVPSIDFVVGSQKTFWLALDGIVKVPDGIYKDRLVAVGFAWAGTSVGSSFFLRSLYSDDMGLTWTKGYHYDPSVDLGLSLTMNETTVTTDTNNDLIMLIRNETGGANGIMTFAKSTDGGKSFKVFSQDTPTFAINCQSGIYQYAPNVWQGVPKIAVTHPSHAARRGLRLRISYNNCASWAKEYQLYPSNLVTGYSSITKVKKDMLGIVCEYGGFNALSNVAIKFINLAEIYK